MGLRTSCCRCKSRGLFPLLLGGLGSRLRHLGFQDGQLVRLLQVVHFV